MTGPLNGGLFIHNNTEAPKVPGGKVLPLFSNKGKTAIVSGAGAGIGLCVAQALAESGANVAIWYNSNKKALQKAADIEKEYGVKCKAYQVNVTDPKHVEESITEIVKEFNGRLDIFVANSGVPWQKGAMHDGDRDEKVDHYRKIITTDLDGTFYCARAAAQHWERQKDTGKDINGNPLEGFTYGSFVATASMSGHIVNIPVSLFTHEADA
jgi:sorbose reductase